MTARGNSLVDAQRQERRLSTDIDKYHVIARIDCLSQQCQLGANWIREYGFGNERRPPLNEFFPDFIQHSRGFDRWNSGARFKNIGIEKRQAELAQKFGVERGLSRAVRTGKDDKLGLHLDG